QKRGVENEKWKLLEIFANLIVEVQPEIVSMENVPELLRFKKGTVFSTFVERLKNVGYNVTYNLAYCPDYGVPQARTRLVLFASKFGDINLIEKTHTPAQYKTVRDVIGKLPPIEARASWKDDPLHKTHGMSSLNLKRIRQSIPGGSWKDWDEELRTTCHKKKSGTHYRSVYGRMRWDEPSPTLTTECFAYGSGRFGHPEQDRAISLREAALLQTFPPEYVFTEPGSPLYFTTIGRYIGNAVPVDLGRAIARSIASHLEEYHDDHG
ncbi:MAG: DNA cytosine methyltransferase, partial [Ktedonobacteraceae bacterium]